MIKHIASVLCRKTIIDQATNNLSIIEELEQVMLSIDQTKQPSQENTEKNFVVPFDFELVSFWEKTETKNADDASMSVDVIDPTGKLLGSFPGELKFNNGSKRLRVMGKFSTLPVTVSGLYRFKVKIITDKQVPIEVTDIPLEINIKVLH